MAWYIFNGLPADPGDPTNYTLVGAEPTCSGSDTLCAIFADDNGAGFPNLIDAIICAMIIAVNTRNGILGKVKLKN